MSDQLARVVDICQRHRAAKLEHSSDPKRRAALWKARVVEPGAYTIRVRSSTGVTLTKILTITPEK